MRGLGEGEGEDEDGRLGVGISREIWEWGWPSLACKLGVNLQRKFSDGGTPY